MFHKFILMCSAFLRMYIYLYMQGCLLGRVNTAVLAVLFTLGGAAGICRQVYKINTIQSIATLTY